MKYSILCFLFGHKFKVVKNIKTEKVAEVSHTTIKEHLVCERCMYDYQIVDSGGN